MNVLENKNELQTVTFNFILARGLATTRKIQKVMLLELSANQLKWLQKVACRSVVLLITNVSKLFASRMCIVSHLHVTC
jgi:hypothetical protein